MAVRIETVEELGVWWSVIPAKAGIQSDSLSLTPGSGLDGPVRLGLVTMRSPSAVSSGPFERGCKRRR